MPHRRKTAQLPPLAPPPRTASVSGGDESFKRACPRDRFHSQISVPARGCCTAGCFRRARSYRAFRGGRRTRSLPLPWRPQAPFVRAEGAPVLVRRGRHLGGATARRAPTRVRRARGVRGPSTDGAWHGRAAGRGARPLRHDRRGRGVRGLRAASSKTTTRWVLGASAAEALVQRQKARFYPERSLGSLMADARRGARGFHTGGARRAARQRAPLAGALSWGR